MLWFIIIYIILTIACYIVVPLNIVTAMEDLLQLKKEIDKILDGV